ncbi:MAG: SBBP repeat-containing protein [Bacteroidota bacterium]
MKKTIIIIILFLLTNTLFATRTKVDKAKEAQAKAWVKKQQLEFIENKGQFTNTEGKPADNVLFKATYGNCDIYITNKGLSYVFVKFEEKEDSITNCESLNIYKSGSSPIRRGGGEVKDEDENKVPLYYRLDMDLVGATIDKTNIIKEEESKQGHYNYFYSHCPEGIYNVKGYGKITIKNIYKGIDWVIYTNPNNKEHPLKYDFVVHPNADYKDIKIKYLNAESTSLLDNDTKLKIQTIAGNIEEGNIYTYQKDNSEIRSNYIINKDSTIAFEVNAYDKTQTLTIDPLVWATYYGGIGFDGFKSIYSDNQNNVYITGYTSSSDFPIQQLTGAFWQASLNGWNLFILRFNEYGVRQWATYYGGTGSDDGTSICGDSQDNIYVTGYTSSIDFPIQQLLGAYWQTSNNGFGTAFILKFNNQGIRQWATFYGGSGGDCIYSSILDNQDNIYIAGRTSSTDFPIQQFVGAYWQATNTGEDAFIVKFNNQGVRQWATYYGGNGREVFNNICTDNSNNIYLTGYTSSTDFPLQYLAGAYWQATYGGGDNEAFIIKFNSQGVCQWATYYGGNGDDSGNSIGLDSQENIYVSGYTNSTDFPVQQSIGAYWQGGNAGGYDAFILKFNNQGVRKWATYYGGINDEYYYYGGVYLCVDKQDNIYVTGQTESYNNFPTQQLICENWQADSSIYSNSYILKFNNQGVRQWSTCFASDSGAFATGCLVNSQNSLYLIGEWWSEGASTKDPNNGAYFVNSFSGNHDSYVLKISNCNNQNSNLYSDKDIICINVDGYITLATTGSASDSLKWYSGGCGQNYIGQNTPLTIPAPLQTTTYYARWEGNGDTTLCDSIEIIVEDCNPLYIPNSFTPNGDGLNDVFNIKTLYEFSESKLVIYDRWGEMIFESDDKNKGWDGTYKGKAVPLDVYIYQFTATIKDTGEQKKITGRVTVVR